MSEQGNELQRLYWIFKKKSSVGVYHPIISFYLCPYSFIVVFLKSTKTPLGKLQRSDYTNKSMRKKSIQQIEEQIKQLQEKSDIQRKPPWTELNRSR